MDLNTIGTVARPRARDDFPAWRAGDAFLAGGTWLFSEPQPQLSRLIDLGALGWEPLRVTASGLEIAATCKIAQLDSAHAAGGMERSAAHQPVHARLPCLVQDLEHGDRRRQYLHVAAGGADDFADRGARWRLHHLEGRRQRTKNSRRRFRHGPAAERAGAGRLASPYRLACVGAAQALGVPADFADAARSFRRAADRDAGRATAVHAHRHRRDAAAAAISFAGLPAPDELRAAIDERCRSTPITTTSTARRPGAGT